MSLNAAFFPILCCLPDEVRLDGLLLGSARTAGILAAQLSFALSHLASFGVRTNRWLETTRLFELDKAFQKGEVFLFL